MVTKTFGGIIVLVVSFFAFVYQQHLQGLFMHSIGTGISKLALTAQPDAFRFITSAPTGRMLRLTVYHTRANGISEEDFHEFAINEHAVKAAAIFARHGMARYNQFFSPSVPRNIIKQMRGNQWAIDTHDMAVEFYFRDIGALLRASADPDFAALQAQEGPWLNMSSAYASFGWVETYIEGGETVSIGEDGRSTYPGFGEMMAIPATEEDRSLNGL